MAVEICRISTRMGELWQNYDKLPGDSGTIPWGVQGVLLKTPGGRGVGRVPALAFQWVQGDALVGQSPRIIKENYKIDFRGGRIP